MRGHIRARRGPKGTTYQLTVYAGLDSSGRERRVYETVRGSRRDADRRLAQLIAEIDAGQRGHTRNARFKDLVEAWWEASTYQLTPNTRIGYRGILNRYLLPTFGNRRIDKIKPADIERWYGQLIRGSASDGRRPLSPVTIRKIHNLASAILAAGVRWGWLPSNPIGQTRPPRGTTANFEPPEPETVSRALAVAAEVNPELHVFLRLSVALGTRRSETAGLRWSDLDFDAREVHVQRALTPDDGHPGVVIEKATKTHAAARLSVDDVTMSTLRQFRATAIERALACGVALSMNAYVFSPSPDGQVPWNPDHFSKAWERFRPHVGMTDVRLHDFRHFHGTELAAAGVPMMVVRDRLRHSNLRTTSIYAHSRKAVDRQAADAIQRVLEGGGGKT